MEIRFYKWFQKYLPNLEKSKTHAYYRYSSGKIKKIIFKLQALPKAKKDSILTNQ